MWQNTNAAVSMLSIKSLGVSHFVTTDWKLVHAVCVFTESEQWMCVKDFNRTIVALVGYLYTNLFNLLESLLVIWVPYGALLSLTPPLPAGGQTLTLKHKHCCPSHPELTLSVNKSKYLLTEGARYICLVLSPGVFIQDLKSGPHAFHCNYSVICIKLLPLPQFALTACFDLLSFCRLTNFTVSTIQWSAHFLHWQENSLLCFSSQLLTHFPHWYLAVGRGMRER